MSENSKCPMTGKPGRTTAGR
ncbi:MAG: hypothetical protein H6Q86_4545, partial [candidate division NC10 bacterium]|nr:hypothetical protein [candidate division NC10 bacterium]